LDRLLADSVAFAPKTSVMATQGFVGDPNVRAAMIAYLRSSAEQAQAE
jgi:hypothetical protein